MSDAGPLFERPERMPRMVMLAMALLGTLLMGATLLLLRLHPFTAARVIGVQDQPEVQAVVEAFHGPIWALEKEREHLRQTLWSEGFRPQAAFTVFSTMPHRIRLIALQAKIGFLLAPGVSPAQAKLSTFQPGRCLVVQVEGKGNLTGFKAFRVARRYVQEHRLKLKQGEYFEVRREIQGDYRVEHWLPLE